MANLVQKSSRLEIIRIVAVYSIFGSLWIYLSDSFLGMIINDPAVMSRLSMYKGLMFIALTAILLYVLIARYIKRISHHIIELDHAQEMLASQKALLDIVVEGTTDAIYIKAVDGSYILANSAVAKFVKKPLEEIIGRDDTNLFLPEEAKELMSQDRWVMAQSAPQTYEEHLTTPDGDLCFLSTKGPMFDSNGTVTGLFGIARDITDRKGIEAELQIATISMNNIADAVYWILPDGKIWMVNEAACKMLGYSKDEFSQLSVPDIGPIFPEETWHTHWQELKKVKSVKLESLHRTKDGRNIPVEISANYIDFAGKELNCATVRDISERKLSEAALNQEQLFAKKLLDSLPGIFYLYSYPELQLVLWNKNHETLLGYTAEEISGRHLFEWHVPEAKDAVSAAVEAVMKKGLDEVEAPLAAKDGSLIPFHLTGVKFEADDKTYLMGVGIDVSARIHAEKALDERNRLLDTLLANLPIGVFMVETPSGKPLIANEKAQELLGRGILPDTSKANLTEVYEAYKLGTRERYPIEEMPIVRGMYGESTLVEDLLVVRPDGTEKLLEIAGAPVIGANGQPWASIVCFQDITDRKQHEKETLKIEKLESLGILAGGIAHDFNNILSGIMGNISFAQMFLDESHKSFKPLAEAEKASARARELSQQLLTFARGGEPIKKTVSISQLIKESVSLVLRGSNVIGKVAISDSLNAVESDEGQISQVFNNIIINATQAMPGGGVLTVTARNETLAKTNSLALPAGSYVVVSFSDEGCGITADNLKRIFDPYFTTKSAGNGLGLASAHSIITRHGGNISATSSIGAGTTFSIYLPSTGAICTLNQVSSNILTASNHHGGTILVMDDEELIRNLTTEMLEYFGYQAKTAVDGAETVELYKSAMKSGTPFTAVIMDLTIPGGIGGMEAAKQILAIDPDACLMVSSGYSNDPIMANYSQYGFKGAVAKPYNMQEFGQLLNSVLATEQ